MASLPDVASDRWATQEREPRRKSQQASHPISVGPSDPIWDMVEDAARADRLPPRYRLLVISGSVILLWTSIAALIALRI